MKNLFLWTGSILASLVVHWVITDRVTNVLSQQPRSAIEKEQKEYVIEVAVAKPEQNLMHFEEPFDFDTPDILIPVALADTPILAPTRLSMESGGETLSTRGEPLESNPYLHHAPGDRKETFADYIQNLRAVGIDIMFVVDATGSMDWVIDEVADRITDIIDTIRSIVPIARFGLVGYRDYDDPEFTTRIQTLTFSRTKMQRFLASLQARGGGSLQEALLAGIETAIDEADWRVQAQKVIIIIGDAPPYERNLAKILSRVTALARRGGRVSTLDVSADSNPNVMALQVGRAVSPALYRNKPMLRFQVIADAGLGVAATLDGDVTITKQLLKLIMGPRFAREMAPLFEEVE